MQNPKQATKQWVESVVIGLNLCPFAKQEFVNDRIRYSVSDANTPEQLLQNLQTEIERLDGDNQIETTLLIHPGTLQDFDHYNQFLEIAEHLLKTMHYEGVFQIASFHPDYQFANAQVDAADNYTNRSPFPMLHIIREASLAKAIAHYPNPERIPQNNIALLNTLGNNKMRSLLKACYTK